MAGDDEDTRPNDGADAERDEVPRPESAREFRLGFEIMYVDRRRPHKAPRKILVNTVAWEAARANPPLDGLGMKPD
jgi:hypothetical protein